MSHKPIGRFVCLCLKFVQRLRLILSTERAETLAGRLGGPKQVLSYLANYTHRVALSNRRIVAVDAQHQTVTFT